MTLGQKMVWAAEFVRTLAEMERKRPHMLDGEHYDNHLRRVKEWWCGAQLTAVARATERASLLPSLAFMLTSEGEPKDSLHAMLEMTQDS